MAVEVFPAASVAVYITELFAWFSAAVTVAEEVIEECAEFPYGDHDDLVDSTTQAIMRFRDGGLIMHPEDNKEEPLIVNGS